MKPGFESSTVFGFNLYAAFKEKGGKESGEEFENKRISLVSFSCQLHVLQLLPVGHRTPNGSPICRVTDEVKGDKLRLSPSVSFCASVFGPETQRRA